VATNYIWIIWIISYSNPDFTHSPDKEKSNAVGLPDQIRRVCHMALTQENEANRLALQ